MNIPSELKPGRTQREPKPLHPFLRGVACFLAFALMFTGPVPMAVAATTDTVTVTTGSISISNLAQSGTILTVVAGGSAFTSLTLYPGSTSAGTLSVGGLIFSGTSAFQDKLVDLSSVSYLQLAGGGSLTLLNGMSVSYGPGSGILLGGSTATLNVGSSVVQGGQFGAPGGGVRVDNIAATRSILTVVTGTSDGYRF